MPSHGHMPVQMEILTIWKVAPFVSGAPSLACWTLTAEAVRTPALNVLALNCSSAPGDSFVGLPGALLAVSPLHAPSVFSSELHCPSRSQHPQSLVASHLHNLCSRTCLSSSHPPSLSLFNFFPFFFFFWLVLYCSPVCLFWNSYVDQAGLKLTEICLKWFLKSSVLQQLPGGPGVCQPW